MLIFFLPFFLAFSRIAKVVAANKGVKGLIETKNPNLEPAHEKAMKISEMDVNAKVKLSRRERYSMSSLLMQSFLSLYLSVPFWSETVFHTESTREVRCYEKTIEP